MKLRKFLYVDEGTGLDDNDDAVLIPVDKIVGIEASNYGTNSVPTGQGGEIVLTSKEVHVEHGTKVAEVYFEHAAGKIKEAMNQVCAAINSNPKNGFIVFDETNDFFSHTGDRVITRCVIDAEQ